ncbi:hypothetical protein J3458_008931 [Metarhizium acridum]|uniref:uncharacterized protein n=1 Tax=Metarhizium acridum TaxID=92637 RepID=UPI001C6AC562|nr:hypothetical protein J3458_008931 [Metarhizium acridum]
MWAHLEEVSSTPRANTEELGQGGSATSTSLRGNPPSGGEDIGALIVQLPNIYTARLLLQHYIQTVDILHRELHAPSTRALLETTYTQLSNSHPIPREVLALFFGIFSSSAFHICSGHSHSHSRCKELQSTTALHETWMNIALDLLLQKGLIVSRTVLSLQALCIIIYLILDSEGQTPTYNTLRGIAHTKALQMKLHLLDAGNKLPDEDVIQVEIKRRLWWCLACTDWAVATVPGPQEGTYSFNPKQFRVKYPLNLDDEDLRPGMGPVEGRPAHEPTSMSFFIEEIRFAELSRDVLDSIQESQVSIHPSSHDLAIQSSNRYQAFIDEMPWFLRPGEDTGDQMTTLLEHRPYIFRQKYVLLHGIYSRMGRLHRPFIARSMYEPRFASSRAVAINCAKQQVKLYRATEPGDLCPYVRSHSIDQHVFGGLVLLAVDIMANKNESGVESRVRELMETAAMIKRKQQAFNPSNVTVVVAIDKLIDVLQTMGAAEGEGDQQAGLEADKTITRTAGPVCRPMSCENAEARGFDPGNMFLPTFVNQDMEELWEELLSGVSSENAFNALCM